MSSERKRLFWFAGLGTLFFLAGLIWLLYWLLVGRFYVYTEDAYVGGNQVMLTPEVASGVKAIYADETDLVEEGQLLVELDRTDHELAVAELKNQLANTTREVAVLFQKVLEKEASVRLSRAELIQAKLDFSHRVGLTATGAISLEEFEQYETNMEVAEAALDLAEQELIAAKLLVEGTTISTHPRVREVAYNLSQAYLNLIRCQVWAPTTGYVAKRTVQVGDRVDVGQTLLVVVPLKGIWFEANFKETHLKRVRIGQPVRFTADMYGRSFNYHGTVVGFQPGTGSAFALLPAQNAEGNWIKIIQRVPIRVTIDEDDLRKRPLVLGLSLRAHVDVHDTSGPMLATVSTFEPLYTTDIYTRQALQMEAFTPVIEDIIENNAGPKE